MTTTTYIITDALNAPVVSRIEEIKYPAYTLWGCGITPVKVPERPLFLRAYFDDEEQEFYVDFKLAQLDDPKTFRASIADHLALADAHLQGSCIYDESAEEARLAAVDVAMYLEIAEPYALAIEKYIAASRDKARAVFNAAWKIRESEKNAIYDRGELDLEDSWFEYFAEQEYMPDGDLEARVQDALNSIDAQESRARMARLEREAPRYTAPKGTWHYPEGQSHCALFINLNPNATDADINAEVRRILPNMDDQSPAKLREYFGEFTRWCRKARLRDRKAAEKVAAHVVRLTEGFRRAKGMAAAGASPKEIDNMLIAEFKDVSADERQNMVANSGLRVEPTGQDVSAFEQGIQNAKIVRTAPAGATQAQIINALLKGSWSL